MLLVCFLAAFAVQAYPKKKQTGLDLEQVRTAVQDTAYYNNLKRQFIDFEELTPADIVNLYHGQVFQENYSPYDKLIWQPKVDKMMKEGKETEALLYCMLLLTERPAYLTLLNYTIQIADKSELGKIFIDDLRKNEASLLIAVFVSGLGDSNKSPYFVTSPADEYLLLNRVLRVEATREGVEEKKGRYYDVFNVKPNDLYKANKVYFDITNFYGKSFPENELLYLNINLTPKN